MSNICSAEKRWIARRNQGLSAIVPGVSLLALLLAYGCAPSLQMYTPEREAPVVAPVSTVTTLPSPTALSTVVATEAPTTLPIKPLALSDDGVSGWCLPPGFALPGSHQPESKEARLATSANGVLNFQIPASSCTLVLVFNQAAQSGMRLQFFEGEKPTPWLAAELTLASDDASIGFVTLQHGAMVDVPTWEIRYPYLLVDASGVKIADGWVRFYRPFPGLCWEGSLPDPLTLACPLADALEREPHPDVTLPAPKDG